MAHKVTTATKREKERAGNNISMEQLVDDAMPSIAGALAITLGLTFESKFKCRIAFVTRP